MLTRDDYVMLDEIENVVGLKLSKEDLEDEEKVKNFIKENIQKVYEAYDEIAEAFDDLK